MEWVEGEWGKFSKSYAQLIAADPQRASTVENILKTFSYLIPGKHFRTQELSELVYALSNLLSLVHDALLRKAAGIPLLLSSKIGARLQVFLTVIEQLEVVLEVVAQRSGQFRHWLVVTVVLLLKTFIRLVLLRQQRVLQTWPAIPFLDRTKLPAMQQTPAASEVAEEAPNHPVANGFPAATWKGQRSGRHVRSLQSEHTRSQFSLAELSGQGFSQLSNQQLLAEMIYITRPLVHLICLLRAGKSSWKPWVLAVTLDALSLCMNAGQQKSPSEGEKAEMSRRCMVLLYYLIRSPCYDVIGRDLITGFLQGLGRRIRPINFVCQSMLEYLPIWQQLHFYTWIS